MTKDNKDMTEWSTISVSSDIKRKLSIIKAKNGFNKWDVLLDSMIKVYKKCSKK